MSKKGTLYLIPVVIAEGKIGTIPDTVRDAISTVDFFLVENVRTARRFISSLKLGLTIEELTFEVLDKNTAHAQVKDLMKPLLEGKNIGILSESGCPGIADPGALAADYAHQIGARVIPLTGPSSLLMALMASGFNGQKFAFHGYLPIGEKELVNTIRKLETESVKQNQTQLFIETPYRNNKLLKKLIETCNLHTRLCVARDITGREEIIKTMTIADWKKQEIDLHKRPTVFLLYAGN